MIYIILKTFNIMKAKCFQSVIPMNFNGYFCGLNYKSKFAEI